MRVLVEAGEHLGTALDVPGHGGQLALVRLAVLLEVGEALLARRDIHPPFRAQGASPVSSAAAAEALEVTAVLHSRGLWPPQSGPGRRNRWTGGPVHIGKGLQVYLSFQCQRMGMYGK